MSTTFRSVPAAATGAVFAITLTIANGQGGTPSDASAVVATAALTLLVAFTVYVGCLLRSRATTPTDVWLAATATVSGAVGACMKLISDAPAIASAHAGVTTGGEQERVLTAFADAITLTSLFPLALFCLAAGLVALRTGALPAWLGVAALVAGAALAVNGCFRDTENVPALLLFALWCLVASVHQILAARRERTATALVSAAS